MRYLPKNYKGLTVVLSHPSRFDVKERKLLSGAAGNFFRYECLRDYLYEEECDIRTSDTKVGGLLENTRGILLLGERAFHEWGGSYYADNYKLQEQRGYPLLNGPYNGIPMVCSFFPQDCMDIQDFESRFNSEYATVNRDLGGAKSSSEEEGEEDTKRRGGATARNNFRFWLKRDVRKLLARLYPEKAKEGSIEKIALTNTLPYKQEVILYPNAEELIALLLRTKNETMFLDIETDWPLPQLSVIGFSYGSSGRTYVVPIHRYDYQPAYGNLAVIFRAFSIAFNSNTLVIHNSQFDLLILAHYYRMLVSQKIYDTMLAQWKMFVEIERSLGHSTSLWTWEPYHKDEGIFMPRNITQERALWEYNAKDIWTMKLIHNAQQRYAQIIPGLKSSIDATNAMCYPYLLNTLMGIRYDKSVLNDMFADNDRLITQYLRLLRIGMGASLCEKVSSGSKTHILGSPKQCVRYYHELLQYPVVARTGDRKPSLAADALYKLKLKVKNNPTIDILLKLRERIKESGSLKFNPWMEEV